jgi:hypothetical protein
VTRQDLGGAVEDLVAAITERVAQAETGLDRGVIEEIVAGFASTRSRIRRLAHALADRPAILTDGRSPAPVAAGDLLIALRAAGATALSAPVCATAGCGKQLAVLQRRGQDWYCSGCYHAGRNEPCAGCGRTRPVATRDQDGAPWCQGCIPRDGRDPADVVVSVVLGVDPGLDRGVVAAAVGQAAWQPRQRDRLARALRQRSDLLTGAGAAAPERSVLRLIDLLADAGATRIARPACPLCAVVKPLRNKRGGIFICWACHSAAAAVACSRCGHLRYPAVRDAAGAPVCSGCRARDPGNLEPCTGCGQLAPVIARTADGPWCRTCKPALTAACFLCGRTRECEISQATGKPRCEPCKQLWARCAHCATFAAIYGGTRRQPLCARCLDPDPAFWRRCPVCARTWQLGKRPCQRCCLDEAVTRALSGGTGVIRDGLHALRQALLATERPATVQAWMARPASRVLLTELARDQRPLTHEILDQFPPGRPLDHLRAVLVAAGGLPPRDERMAFLQRWITTIISERGDPREREILHQYARWYLLRRLRGRLTQAGPAGGEHPARQRHTSDREKDNIRHGVHAAIRVLDLAAGNGLTLADITQADLDTWAAADKFTYRQATGTFIRWAVARRYARPGLKPHYGHTGSTQQRPHNTERRWHDARRLLHDESLPLPDRIAGLLVLLYAQNLADIESMTTAAVDDDGTTLRLTLATAPIVLPDPLAGLMREHLATRRGHATIGQPGDVPWLFPGGRPGHPLDAGRISDRLKAIGLHPRADRAAALFTLAAELPAAILARTLGISIRTAVSWQKTASGDWMTYAAAVSRRHPGSGSASRRRYQSVER